MWFLALFRKDSINVLSDIKNIPIQPCRLFAYHNKILVAVSLKFHLVFPHKPPSMTIVSRFKNVEQAYKPYPI